MFFIFSFNKKPKGQETRKVFRNGMEMNAQITVYRKFFVLFFIPLIPLGKSYSVYIPQTDEYFEQSMFSKIPEDLLEVCREVGRMY